MKHQTKTPIETPWAEATAQGFQAWLDSLPHDKITRLTVVDDTGRAYEKWNVRINFSLQDQGRTLKIFVEQK